jgi:hypothetical protein
MLMAVFIASASALIIDSELCNRISLISVGVTTAHPNFPSIFDPSVYISYFVFKVVSSSALVHSVLDPSERASSVVIHGVYSGCAV